MKCPHCRGSVMVEIGMLVAGGRLTMHSCPLCENRWWDRDGEPVALDGVLSSVSAA